MFLDVSFNKASSGSLLPCSAKAKHGNKLEYSSDAFNWINKKLENLGLLSMATKDNDDDDDDDGCGNNNKIKIVIDCN
jgi:hypothetical protein